MYFQRGDKRIVINDKPYGLRLTMGVLAEINSRLSVKGPQQLSARLRSLNAAEGRVLLACTMRPCLPREGCIAMPAENFSDVEIARAMPVICKLFEEAFTHDG